MGHLSKKDIGRLSNTKIRPMTIASAGFLLYNKSGEIGIIRVRFVSVAARLRRSSAKNSESKSDLKSSQKPLDGVLLRLPKSCLIPIAV